MGSRPSPRTIRHHLAPAVLGAVLALGGAIAPTTAQTAAGEAPPTNAGPPVAHKPKSHSISGSPLDTIMQTHLWTDVPPAEGFVRETSPDPKSLDYAPLTGVDPDRAKPRDKANIAALQAEMESLGAQNEKKGHALRGPLKPAKKATR